MTDAEIEQYLTQIISRAPDPATAARAIMAGGFCSQTSVDAELALLWEQCGPRTAGQNMDRRAITIKWRPTKAYVRAWRFDAPGRDIPSAIRAVNEKAKEWYEAADPLLPLSVGWSDFD